ncbi:hypothetical protein ACWGLF_39565 [Streptomyces puniciscabiei]
MLVLQSALEKLSAASSKTRRRLVAVNASAFLIVLWLSFATDDSLAIDIVGRVTVGMALLGCQLLIVLVSVVWYDRACAARCDPYVVEIHAAFSSSPEAQR